MLLQSQGKINLDLKLSDYLPELVENSPTKNIVLRAMLSHQAGFTPFFPFYKKTIHNKQLDSTVYNSQKTAYFNQQVAANLYINNHYRDTMMAEILQTPLKTPGKYVYSDVGYYFVQRIIEKITGQTQDVFVQNAIYKQLGLNRTGYNPLTFYPLNKIAPTENDKLFRHQLIQGFVHDQGAAMQGGVAGHAGVFSNATDLLAIMQLFLNKGSYAGKQLIKKEVVEEYTKAQFPGNRRGIGFDRPTSSGENGPVTSKVSQQSFGHSGFTGTYVWADPQNELTYVFLSNRVYPDAENWKILSNKVRSTIHGMMYDIIATK
jgi:CubicO group peptidase (beta-lactamase class C family)